MIYLKDNDGRLKTIKDLANKYGISRGLIVGRYQKGIRDIEKLTEPKYKSTMK